MAMLLVAVGVMTILWTAALPAWSQLAKREKEEELVFRGNQYARAIGLYQRKYANASPPSLDVLIDQKFLRRKYKDPMVADGEFQLLYQTPNQPGLSGPAQQPAPQSGRGQQQGLPQSGRGQLQGPLQLGRGQLQTQLSTRAGGPSQIGSPGGPPQTVSGGIIGVTSKSKEESLRIYNGRTHYNEWQFIYLATALQPGTGGDGRGGRAGPFGPGGLGGPGGGRAGRGGPLGAPFGPGGPGGRGRVTIEEGPDGRRMFRLEPFPDGRGPGRGGPGPQGPPGRGGR